MQSPFNIPDATSCSVEKNIPNNSLPQRLQALNNEIFIEALSTATAQKIMIMLRESLTCAAAGRSDLRGDSAQAVGALLVRIRDQQTFEITEYINRQLSGSPPPVPTFGTAPTNHPASLPWRSSFRWLWEIVLLAAFIAAGIKLMRS